MCPRLKLQSLGHYLGKTMTLCDLIWVNPAEHLHKYIIFPPFQSSATRPARPVGGGEERVNLAKLKSLYTQRGVKVMLRSSCQWRYDRHLVRAYLKDRYDDANGLGVR